MGPAEQGAGGQVGGGEAFRAFPDLVRFPLPEGELVYAPLSRTAHAVPAFLIALAQCCRSFAPLEEHAARIARENNLGPEQARAVLEHLRALAGADLLTARAELAGWFRPGAAPPGPITAVGVPTRDRPQALRRCLESCLDSLRRHGRAPALAVADDSSSPEALRADRECIRSLVDRHGAEIAFIGPEEKRRFLAELVREGGFEPDVLEFALLNPEGCPLATGANRNALLLFAAGELLLQLDDDTLCQALPAPDARAGLAFSSLFDPTELWFLDEDNAPQQPGAADLLAVHERLLGQGLGDCHAGLPPEQLELGQANASFFRPGAREAGKVLATSAGVVGHSGMGSSMYFLRLEGASRERLLRSEATYRRAMSHHRVLRAVTRATVCESAYCMAVNLGLDNRGLLPPFFPVQRNQDGVFAALLRAVRPDGYQGYLPWAVRHEPPAPRAFSQADLLGSVAGLGTGQIVQFLLRALPAPPAGRGGRPAFDAVGRALQEWAELPPADFEELLRLRLWPSQSRQATHLAGLLQQYRGLPEAWARDVRQVIGAVIESLPARGYAVPADLPAKGEEGAVLFQRLLGRFGRLLRCWPDVVAAARALRERGVRPGG